MDFTKSRRPPRVLVNLISLFQGGPKTVGFGLVEGIWETPGAMANWRLMLPSGVGYEALIRDLGPRQHIETLFMDYPTDRMRFIKKLYLDHVVTARLARSWQPDLLFMTANFTSLLAFGPKQVVLQHNAHYFERKNPFASSGFAMRLRYALERLLFKVCTWKSADYVTQLEVIKQKLALEFSIEPGRIRVVKMVPPRQFWLVKHSDEVGEVSPAHNDEGELGPGLDDHWLKLFFPALNHPNKNHRLLLPLAELLLLQGSPAAIFVTLPADCAFMDEVKARHLDQVIINLGYIPYDRIATVYQRCDALLYPSYVESYGFPYVEAILSGRPIVTADYEFAREVCGDAALYYQQDDVVSLLQAIVRLTDADVLTSMRQHAKERAQSFSHGWQVLVQEILGLDGAAGVAGS